MKPIEVRIQNYDTQTGIPDRFAVMWKYGAGRQKQRAYQIDVFLNEELVFSTGKIISDEQNNICLEHELIEQTEYNFTVSVWDEKDQKEISEKTFFLTGVKDWKGDWIGNDTKKPFLARKRFWVPKDEKAVLSVCVPGQFEVRINGHKISQYTYEGSQTNFDKHVHYSTYDISESVIKGENEITIECANGWYLGDNDNGKRHFYTMDKGYRAFGDCLAVLAQLKAGAVYVVTDTSWEIAKSMVTLANIYGSEDIDHTIDYVWEQAKCVQGPKGEVIPGNYPPVIRKYEYLPVQVDHERMIFDFGQNMSSQFYLRVNGKKGQKVRLLPAEKLDSEGNIQQTVNTYSVLTLGGGEEEFEQRFSVTGARWYKVEGVKFDEILEFKTFFATSSAEDCGSFWCSDERMNQIYRIILKAVESNLNHSHTDCPTIEKLGWLEPDHLMARAIMYNKNVDMLWSKIAMDMRDSQYTEGESDIDNGAFAHEYKNGLIPSIAPRYAKFTTDWREGSFWDIIPWGSSIVLAAYEQYLFYGNKQVLLDNFKAAKDYIKYLTEQYEEYPRLYGEKKTLHFICAGLGDWGYEQNKGRSRENIETAFYYHDLMIMAEISKILAKNEEVAFRKQAEQVKKKYNELLLIESEEGEVFYTDYKTNEKLQANQAIPLCFGMVPKEHIAKVRETLIQLCEGKHLDCGEIGLVYILRALSSCGRNDIIYDMIMKDTHPSYLRFVEMGETTLPEFWRDDARSRNHDMMGHIMEWFFAEVAGIKSQDGFRTVRINPGCMDFIDSFVCEYDSVRGKIRVQAEHGKISWSVPANMSILWESK